MAAYMNFDLLPALSEGDERISLADILSIRDSHLTEDELWAVCRGCCVSLKNVHNSSEVFQLLCITPDSLAFDSSGNICFLDLGTEPQHMYIPPEYEKVGNSYKAHVFSVGMTMLYAAEYSCAALKKTFSQSLNHMLTSMTNDDYYDRADLDTVFNKCAETLSQEDSDRICRQLAAVGRLEHRMSSEDTTQSENKDITLEQESGVPTPEAINTPNTPADSTPKNSNMAATSKSFTFDKNDIMPAKTHVTEPSGILKLKLKPLGSLARPDDKTDSNQNTVIANTQDGSHSSSLLKMMGRKLRLETRASPSLDSSKSLQDILSSLQGCLHENEIWAVCHQAVIAVMKQQPSLPSYISMDTITLVTGGMVEFCAIPQKAEINAVFLAPELDKGGCLTDKASLFGLAASLWAAADYKLPTSAEPQLSNKLQELLLSMAHDDPSCRPTLRTVLHLCSKYEKQNGVSSQDVCGNLLKACQRLTPKISADVKEKLLAEIVDPSKKLRKSSKPREMDVSSMFRENTDLMLSLRKVTGKPLSPFTQVPSANKPISPFTQAPSASAFRQSPKSTSSPVQLEPPSAFRSTIQASTKPLSVDPPRLPSAFNSSATHFTPIVLTGNESTPVKDKMKPKVSSPQGTLSPTEKDLKVAQKLKQLKKNLIKNRAPINIANDIENEAAPVGKQSNDNKTSNGNVRKPDATVNVNNTALVRPVPKPVARQAVQPMQSGQGQTVITNVQGFQAISPGNSGQQPVQQELTSIPIQQGVPVQCQAQPVQMSAPAGVQVPQGMFPNFQLQQDPHTGLFQLVPVVVPGIQILPPGSVQSPQTATPSSERSNPIPQTAMPSSESSSPIAQTATPSSPRSKPKKEEAKQTGSSSEQDSPSHSSRHGVEKANKPSGKNTLQSGKKSESEKSHTRSKRTDSSSSEKSERRSRGRTKSDQDAVILEAPDDNDKGEVKNDKSKRDEKNSTRHRSRSLGRDKSLEDVTQNKSRRSRSSSRDRVLNDSRNSPSDSSKKNKPPVLEKLKASKKNSAPAAPSSVEGEKADKIYKKREKTPRQSSKETNDSMSESERKERNSQASNGQDSVREDVSMSSASESDVDRGQSGGSFLDERKPRSILKKKLTSDSLKPDSGNTDRSPREKLSESSSKSSRKPAKSEKTSPVTSPLRLPLSLPHESSSDGSKKQSLQSRQPSQSHSQPSPMLSPSPPPSPSLSRDSGVSGMNNVLLPSASLMERLLNPDTLRNQQILAQVVKLIREEFAFDGYLENGVEDTAMAEYVASLGNLKLPTFASAISEKYCDLFWQEELLIKLFEAVNGRMPSSGELQGRKPEEFLSSATATVLSIDEPTQPKPRYQRANQRNFSFSPFRPIASAQDDSALVGSSGSLLKPRALRLPRSYTDTSDDTDAENIDRHYRRRRHGGLDKAKSSSMHDLLHNMRIPENQLNGKSLSQTALDKSPANFKSNEFLPRTSSIAGQRPKVIHVRGSGSDTDTMDMLRTTPSDWKPLQNFTSSGKLNTGQKINDSLTYESDSSSATDNRFSDSYCSGLGRNIRREESQRSFSSCLSVFSTGESSDNSMARSESRTSLPTNTGNVVFYSLEPVQSDVKDFENQMGPKTKDSIKCKITEVEQQLVMEDKQRRKTQRYYKKLLENLRSSKATGEQRGMLTKVSNQIREMTAKLSFLTAAKRHLEMLYSEQWGIDHNLLYSLSKFPANQPLRLASAPENPLLQYQTMYNRMQGTDSTVLHAGTPLGLMAFLFAKDAITDGFIHQFFLCYRYFSTSRQLLDFIAAKLSAAICGDPPSEIQTCVQNRAMDLLHVWLEGYFSVDFKHDLDLCDSVYNFIQEQVLPIMPQSKALLQVMDSCRTGEHAELGSTLDISGNDVNLELVPEGEATPNKWGSLKAAFNLSSKPSVLKKKGAISCMQKKNKDAGGDVYFPKVARKEDAFTLADYTSQTLAEQLAIIEQEFFTQCHPVHFMNSQAQGIGVSLADAASAPKSGLRQSVWDDPEYHVSSKFAGSYTQDAAIQDMIEHAHNISYWVAAELVSCSSSKSQLGLLSKFIHTAKICMDMRNYASGISILEGLENLLIRQLPSWRNLPSKSVSVMEELSSIKVSLKGDSGWLVKDDAAKGTATIPPVLLFMLHVQQIELGGFTLANGMYKWNKMRSISKLIDQVRMFKCEQRYTFEANKELQDLLRIRIHQLSEQDLHSLAAQHFTNFTKMSSSKWNKALKSLKGKFDK